MTYGHGDSTIPQRARQLHDQACAEGRPLYRDPVTGYAVFTTQRLRAIGECCGAGCRHCPYDRQEQLVAGRRRVRPEP